MLQERTFRVAVSDPMHPFRFDPDAKGAVSIRYSGAAVEVKIN